jgi:ABC-2 type transport system permease protein
MLLTTVFSKTILDRWRGVTIGVVSLAALLYFGMVVYQDIDLSIYSSLPPAFESLIGIGEDADVASLAYNAIYSSYGAIILAGIAIAMGSAFIAGEERKGTIGVLLGNPRSRSQVLVAKTAAMLVLMGLGGLALWGAGLATPASLDVSIEGMDVTAFTLHLVVGTLFYGFLALAIGAWTGRTGVASGVSAGVLAVSFFAVGLLPMIEGAQNWAKAFPWYYFAGSDPLMNGVDGGHIAVLGGASLALFVVAFVGVNRRDLRSKSTGVSLVDTLRAHPLTAAATERLAGGARVSHIWVKSASEHQGLLLVVSGLMFFVMGVMMGPIYSVIDDAVIELGASFPEQLLALFGGGDLSTPEGYYQIESFGLVTPIALMVVTITLGAKALAGEEENRTMGILLANPVRRSTVLSEKLAAMVLYAVTVGMVVFAGTSAGNWISSLGMDYSNIAATAALATLVGLLFGALALLVGALTGRTRFAIFIPVGAALVLHTMNALASLSDSWWGRLSPFYYYLGSDPLNNGMAWGDAGVLLGLTAALVALAYPAFNRRDLRQTG